MASLRAHRQARPFWPIPEVRAPCPCPQNHAIAPAMASGTPFWAAPLPASPTPTATPGVAEPSPSGVALWRTPQSLASASNQPTALCACLSSPHRPEEEATAPAGPGGFEFSLRCPSIAPHQQRVGGTLHKAWKGAPPRGPSAHPSLCPHQLKEAFTGRSSQSIWSRIAPSYRLPTTGSALLTGELARG